MAGVIRQIQRTDGRQWLEDPETEYKFDKNRKWRFDFAWPKMMIALEAEGGTWTEGGHVRGKGYENDCTKYNEATAQGWKVYRFTTDMVYDGPLFNRLEKLFAPF
jgi:hypothetical protein